jgi:hypothetical protein
LTFFDPLANAMIDLKGAGPPASDPDPRRRTASLTLVLTVSMATTEPLTVKSPLTVRFVLMVALPSTVRPPFA